MNEVRDEAQKSPERLEREIDETRADISDAVDALARKFSPGELLDRSLGVVKEHGGDVAINLRESIKEKPLAALLTGIGLAWLMVPTSHDRSRKWASDKTDYSTAQEYERSESWTSADTGSTVSRARESLSGARESLSGTGEKIKGAMTGARERLSGASTSVSQSVSRTTASAKTQAALARDRFNSLKDQEPLILGVVGLAVGAVLGAALPRSETEDRLVGSASDATKDELKTKARDVYGQAREKAEKATEAAGQALSEDRPSTHA